MNRQATSPEAGPSVLTQHALLVAWGVYAQQIGLVEQISQVKIKQKQRRHRPQSKVLEFLVAMLAGCEHLQDISRSAHPLDQDSIVAEAWGQPGWADYSGVGRTLQGLSAKEAADVMEVLKQISQPFIEREVEMALQQNGYLVYDADLTGRPVSSTSTSYPDTAFGYMGDTVCLGYQAALVSLHSPSYGRLWLANQLHPGDTVSMTEAKTLLCAAETGIGLRPRRRTELVVQQLAQAETRSVAAEERLRESEELLHQAKVRLQATEHSLRDAQRTCQLFEAEYAQEQRQPTLHCKLSRVQRQVAMYKQRLPRSQQALQVAERRQTRHLANWTQCCVEVAGLRQHLSQLEADNASNLHPIRIIVRIDGGFASNENLAWLIEMGYELYSKARCTTVRNALVALTTASSNWQRVGANAQLLAWANTTVEGHFIYPMNVALAHYQTGDTHRHAVLLHYGTDDVTHDLQQWFHAYNARQSIEAGIKEGKGVFQMHHLKVRSAPALLLQEHFACFAANFVRFAAAWLAKQQLPSFDGEFSSVKRMVRVAAHTSALVLRHGDVWLLTFTQHSCYAGSTWLLGAGPRQLPLPGFPNFYFCDS